MFVLVVLEVPGLTMSRIPSNSSFFGKVHLVFYQKDCCEIDKSFLFQDVLVIPRRLVGAGTFGDPLR